MIGIDQDVYDFPGPWGAWPPGPIAPGPWGGYPPVPIAPGPWGGFPPVPIAPWVWSYIRLARADPGNIAAYPVPVPWRFIGDVVSIVGVKAAVRALRDEALQERLASSLDSNLKALLDWYCGTLPPRPPRVGPGPHPYVYSTAAQLALLAHSLPAGEMRDDLIGVSADLVQRAGELQQAVSG